MTKLFQKLAWRVWRVDEKRQARQYGPLILEMKTKIDQTMGHSSRVSLRTPTGYNSWRVSWVLDEKAKFRYPRLKQTEHRPVRIYNLHSNSYYRSPYSLPRQKGKFRRSFHFPFAPDEGVIAEFVIYTLESLAEEKSQILRNIVESYLNDLSEMALAAHSLRVNPWLC